MMLRSDVSRPLIRLIAIGTVALASCSPQPTGLTGPANETMAAGYALEPVPVEAVRIDDEFWSPRIETNRTVTIPHIIEQNEETGRHANFAHAGAVLAGDEPGGTYSGRRFNDTDVYKIMEAAAYSLIAHPDPDLEARLDELVQVIAAAQEPDGYLYPARTIDPENPPPGTGDERWAKLSSSHELYNFGHMYEAAIAHHRATGKTSFLDIATRNADFLAREFGPDRRRTSPGHEEIEIALVKLYRATGTRAYLELAEFFLRERGRPRDEEPYPDSSPFSLCNDEPYQQNHLPVTEQHEAVGHAVRGTYLYAGMADVAALAEDRGYAADLEDALDAIWDDVVGGKLYVTGGLRARHTTEAFGDDFELPNRAAYTETCAAIGHELWNWRMYLLHGDSRYIDLLERVLYNGFLSGVSLEGDRFFYQNPLESEGRVERSTYFEVACCPGNVARTLAQLPGLVYARDGDGIRVNLFIAGNATIELPSPEEPGDALTIDVVQRTRYPWEGDIELTVTPRTTDGTAEFSLHLRIPGWARGRPVPGDLYRFVDAASGADVTLTVNGEEVPVAAEAGFATLRRAWQAGDVVRLHLPTPVRRVVADPRIRDDSGRVSLQRGPLVYAVEAIDNGGNVLDLAIPEDTVLDHEFRADLLGGVEVVTARAERGGGGASHGLVTIPYYAWANRGPGEMAVWIPIGRDPRRAR